MSKKSRYFYDQGIGLASRVVNVQPNGDLTDPDVKVRGDDGKDSEAILVSGAKEAEGESPRAGEYVIMTANEAADESKKAELAEELKDLEEESTRTADEAEKARLAALAHPGDAKFAKAHADAQKAADTASAAQEKASAPAKAKKP